MVRPQSLALVLVGLKNRSSKIAFFHNNNIKTFKMLPFEEQKQGYFPCGQPRQCSGISEILVVVGGICMNRRLKEVDYYSKEKIDNNQIPSKILLKICWSDHGLILGTHHRTVLS